MTIRAPLFGLETEYSISGSSPSGARLAASDLTEPLFQRVLEANPHLPGAQEAGVFLAQGSRFLIDFGNHPELATPECSNPTDAVRYARAGDRIVARAAADVVATCDGVGAVFLTRCNVDYAEGGTCGAHESYLHRTDGERLAEQIIPHLASRLVYAGAGGFDNLSSGVHFLLSPRVPHLRTAVSSDSIHHRGIFHTKNEPLCSGGYARLHILCGESNCSETSTWLKVGTTALVVAVIDAGGSPASGIDLGSPVAAMRAFARDPRCLDVAGTRHGPITAIEIQRKYLTACEARIGKRGFPPWAEDVCRLWRSVLDRLDEDPRSLATTLDWAIKLELFRAHVESRGIGWGEINAWNRVVGRIDRERARRVEEHVPHFLRRVRVPSRGASADAEPAGAQGPERAGLEAFRRLRSELFEIDLRFGEVDRGLFAGLDAEGVLDHRVAGVDRIEEAVEKPPPGGRAFARGEAIRRLAPLAKAGLAAAKWTGVRDDRANRDLDLRNPYDAVGRWVPRTIDEEDHDDEGPAATNVLARMRRRVADMLDR